MAKAMPAASKPPVEDDDESLLTDLLPNGAASSDDPVGSVEAPAAIIGGGGIDNGAGVSGLFEPEELGEDYDAEIEDERPRARMSKSEIAHSDEHQLTHKPFNEYCPVCVRAKSQNKPHRRKGFNRELDHFGQIVTMDQPTSLTRILSPESSE